MNFFAISMLLLIAGGSLILLTHRTMRLSRLDQLQHLSELAKMHKELCKKVSLMDNRYIELKTLADKIGNNELAYESNKLLEENKQIKRELMLFEAATIGPFLKPSSSEEKES